MKESFLKNKNKINVGVLSFLSLFTFTYANCVLITSIIDNQRKDQFERNNDNKVDYGEVKKILDTVNLGHVFSKLAWTTLVTAEKMILPLKWISPLVSGLLNTISTIMTIIKLLEKN